MRSLIWLPCTVSLNIDALHPGGSVQLSHQNCWPLFVREKLPTRNFTDTEWFSQFRRLRTQSNNLHRRLHISHYKTICNEYSSSPCRLWATINHVTKRKQAHTPSLVGATDRNNYFQNIVADASCPYDIPNGPLDPNSLSSFVLVSETAVLGQLKALNPRKAPGPDGMLPNVLEAIAASPAPSLTVLFKCTLSQGGFPTAFKQANVTSILKSSRTSRSSPLEIFVQCP